MGTVRPAKALAHVALALAAAFVIAAALSGALSPAHAAKSPGVAPSPHVRPTNGTAVCEDCHVPHKAASRRASLRTADAAGSDVAMCAKCHKAIVNDLLSMKSGVAEGSGHRLVPSSAVATPDASVGSCSTCHDSHLDAKTSPMLIRGRVNGVVTGGSSPGLCLSCHDDKASWYRGGAKSPYPPLSAPVFDSYGYPVSGVYPGASVYTSAGMNAHARIPASKAAGRTEGDCLWCHAAHVSSSAHDALRGGLRAPRTGTVAHDQAWGEYASACFACHDGSWVASGAVDIKRYVTSPGADAGPNAGHRVKSPGGRLPVGSPLPCYDCHGPHGSARGNASLISDALGGSLETSGGPESVRRFCLTCHTTSDAAMGWDSAESTYTAVGGSAAIEGLPRDGGAVSSFVDGELPNLLRLRAVPGHASGDRGMSCYDCHGATYGPAGSSNVHAPASVPVTRGIDPGRALEPTVSVLPTAPPG